LVDGRPVRSAVTRYHLKRLGILLQVVNNMNAVVKAFPGQNGAAGSR
jgi:arabidopsis histidine kinase 2/3/4 (cytokinin receptor)